MSDFFEWLFEAMSEFKWLRRIMFAAIIALLLYLQIASFSVLGILLLIWGVMELPDYLRRLRGTGRGTGR